MKLNTISFLSYTYPRNKTIRWSYPGIKLIKGKAHVRENARPAPYPLHNKWQVGLYWWKSQKPVNAGSKGALSNQN